MSVFLGANLAHAACSPGIPCADYDLYTQWNAGTTASLNGPKTGLPVADYDERTCDGNFMNQIYSKAYMEGSRQILMSEQIIHKPDSVLEYTCFQSYAEHAATIETEFSYTSRWEDDYEQDRETADETITDTFDVYREDFNDGDTDCGSTGSDSDECVNDLGEAIEYLVIEALETYLDQNFDHTYLGEALSIDYTPGGGTNCSEMATVWNIAKCLDFGEDDQFRTFYSLTTGDPRTIPEECSPGQSASDAVEAGNSGTQLDNTSAATPIMAVEDMCPPAGTAPTADTNLSTDLIRLSNNCPSPADDDNKKAYASVDLIELQDHLLLGAGYGSGMYFPGTGGHDTGVMALACQNQTPIPTGIPVVTYEHEWDEYASYEMHIVGERQRFLHYEHMCLHPGCYYRPVKLPIDEEGASAVPVIPTFDDYLATVPGGSHGLCVRY